VILLLLLLKLKDSKYSIDNVGRIVYQLSSGARVIYATLCICICDVECGVAA